MCYLNRTYHVLPTGKYLNLASKIAEGYVGLKPAICRFDPGRGVPFTAYAAWRVREAIHEHIVRTMGCLFSKSRCSVTSEVSTAAYMNSATLRCESYSNKIAGLVARDT